MADGRFEDFRRALLGRGLFAHVAPLRLRPGVASIIWESLVSMRRCSREEFANNGSAQLLLYIYRLFLLLGREVCFQNIHYDGYLTCHNDLLLLSPSENQRTTSSNLLANPLVMIS